MALFVNSNPYDDEEISYAQEDTGVLNEFGKGFGAGVDQLQALAGGAKALVGSAVGNDDWFYEGMEYFDEQMAEAAENAADVGRLEDIEGIGDLANYSAFIVGNIIPSLIGGGGVGAIGGAAAKKLAINQGAKALVKKNAEGMAKSAASRQYAQSAIGRETLGKTGLKGQMVGATAFGTAMGAGESFTRILDETGEEAAGLALVTGLASGALDAMTPMRVLKRVLPQNLYGKATQEIAENVSKKQSVIGRAFKEAAKASGTEGVTEMMQEVVQNSALEFVRGQQDPAIEEAFLERLFDEENRSQYLNAFVAGAIGGGAIGGVTGAVTKDPELKQNLDEDALRGEPEGDAPESASEQEQAQDDQPSPEATDRGGEKVQAARAKGLGLPTARTTIAPKTLEEVRAELDALPEQREASDPEARQAEARDKARAQIDGLPAVREKVKEIYQMELGTLGETTRIPKDKEPEPVAEEAPVFGGNLPESITPRMEELVGQDVDYNGNKGPVIKKDDGFYVATQDNGDVLIESGEFQSPEQLGVVPTGGNLVFEQDVQIDDNNKFELRGKKYSLARIIRDADGNPLSLAVRDEKGAKKTIRTPEVVARINNQKTPVPDFSQIIVELDDLPASIQKQIIQQSDADSIPESVPASQAIEIAQSLPNAESVVEGIREVATQNLTIPKGTAGTMPAVPYTENVVRPNMKPLAEAIADINSTQGANRTPIDQGRIDGLFDAPEVTMMNGERVTTAEGVQADEIKSALVDLLGSGMPKRVMKHFKGLYVHAPAQMEKEVDGSYLKSSQIITMNGARVNELIADKDNSGDSAINLRFNLAHEIGHAFDVGTGHTNSSPDFSLEVDGLGMNSATYEMGPVIHELGQNYLSGTDLGQELAYPFGGAFEWIANSQPEAMVAQVDRIKKEAFAQAFAIFHSSPELLQEQAPTTYKHLEQLLRAQPTEINQDGEADIRSNETDGIPQDVQGEVRAPAERRGDEVQEQGGAGGDGGSSLDAEQANQRVAEPTQRADGDGAGRAVQLEPAVKRAEDFANTGNYNVSYQDGTEYLIYRDTMQFADPMWHLSQEYYDILELDSNAIERIGGIGGNRKEALQWLNKAHSERLEKAEAEAVQQELGDIDDDYDPMDDLASFDDDALYAPSNIERLQAVDPSYNQAKVRSLSQLQVRIPLNDRIAGDYVEGQPLTPVAGGKFSDLDLANRGDGLNISQADLDSILREAVRLTDTNAEGQVGDLAKKTVERLEINANTVEFWNRALKLSDNARYWYEVSAEAMRDVMPDLSPSEIRQFISVVAATSPVANPFVNMHRAMASFSNHLQGKAIDNDLVIPKGVTDALKTADLEGLKTGSFGGTMQLVLGMAKPTLSTNDRQVAATFNTDGEAIGKNPELYEVMSRFYMGLRDKLNANLPDGAQPYETWQLQALGWVEQRYKNEFVKDKQADGMSEKAALAAYQSASPEDISGGVNDVDDYSMSLLRKDSSGRRDRKGVIQILKEAGIAVPDDKITKEILLDPRVPAALSPTTATFREKRTITAEINSLRNDIGKDARAVFDAAIEQSDQKIADEYHSIFATLLNKSSQGATNPFTAYFKALGLSKVDAKPTRVSTPTGGVPLAVGGTYEGDVSPNVRVPVPSSITSDQLNVLMTSLSKQWDQDAVPASHIIDIADGLREGYTETSQVFVETLGVLSRDQIEAFASALPEGVEVNFTRYPNGYEFNVLAFDQETFDPITPDMNEIAAAAEAMQDQTGGSITNLHVKDAQWQPAGYSEIGNYDDVFASFKESLYTEQAQKLIGKIQRKQNGKVRDLTEKQIVAELKQKNKSEDLAGQGNARIQRAHGTIEQRLSDFQQAEGIAKGLAEARDTKLKLFIQKNSKTLRVSPQVDDQLDSPPSRDSQEPADLTKVIPKVARAYKQFKAGEIDRETFDNTVLSTISDYAYVPDPATFEEMNNALTSDKKPKINLEIEDGELVGMRLDIPAYMNKENSAWVPALHFKKDGVSMSSYQATGSLTDVTFGASQKTSQLIMEAEEGKAAIDKQLADGLIDAKKAKKLKDRHNKSSYAKMNGSYVKRTDAENLALAKEAINDPDWTQVGFDPRRHSYFYDRKTGQPILNADEVIQVGPLVLAKNAESGVSDDFLYSPTRSAVEIMSDEELVASVRAGTTSGGGSGIPSGGIKKWLQKNFSSRGLLPETAFDSMIQRDGEFGAVELDIRQMVGIYDNAVVENFGKIDGQQREVLDDAMKRPASEIEKTSLPRDIKDSLIAMRGYIDSLSAQYAQVLNDDINTLKAQGDEQALAKSELLGIVVNNMGTYANRSYQAFNNKDWNKEVPDEVVLAARNFLVEQGTANPDQVVNTILKEGTAYDDMASFISESKLGAKDLAILTQRKQIAPEIRALLGEFKDPRVNFANSASKMSRLIYNDRFLKEVLESGNGVFLFDQESAPADATKKIAEVGSKTMSPLNGMYTYPEVEQAFRDALGKEEMGDLYRTIIKVNGLVKYGKTVIAPTTMFRNFMSASMFTVANGHFNWSKLSKSAEVAGSYFSGIGDGVEYLKNLKKLGVVHDSPYAGEMIAYLQDANAQGLLDQRDPSAILDVKDSALTAGKSAAQFFTKAYQFGDDFWKIVGFENEVMSFMGNKGMSREEAEPLAAKRIRDTYPTYSLIGKIPQQLRRFPLVGTFVSFPAEIVRTQANMIKYLREDLADPDMRPAALKRIAGMAMMSAGVYAAQAMAMSAFGVSEEEEEAIKLMAAPWAKNSNILVTGRDDQGRLEYLDLTHLDPYALMKRPLNALMRDQPIDDALIDASAEILKPFLGWDISTNTILEFISNEKSSGGQVYNEADTFINQVGDTYLHFERGMGPSVAQNVRRMSRAMGGEISKSGKAYDVDDEMAALVGFRKTTFDPKTALHFKAYEFSEGKRQSTRLLTSVFRDPNDVSDSDIREAFGRASIARRETFEDMAALVNAAMSSGLSATQAMTILRSNGVTKKDSRALIQGGASAWTMSDSTLKNSIAKSDVLFGQQKSQEFKDRWSLIQQLLDEEAGVER